MLVPMESIERAGPAVTSSAPTLSGSSPAVDRMLADLDPEQRAAARLPDGPSQIIAPAGSGKTTTLIARLGHLASNGVAADRICVVTFNRDAAMELRQRIERRLAPVLPGAERIEVRTIHALARQILLERHGRLELVADRQPLLRAARRRLREEEPSEASTLPPVPLLDTWLSAWKINGDEPPPKARAVLARYARLLADRGARDFDDLVVEAADLLERDAVTATRWQARFSHVCVDEFQDVDAAQLRLVRLLAEPERNLFVVGDDDQTIYAWRLADVRRILDFGALYPDARRVQLQTNYRCPPVVVHRSAQLIAVNRERFAKRIVPGPWRGDDPVAAELLALPTDLPDWPERLVRTALDATGDGARCCFLARTRAELAPVALALVRREVPHVSSVPDPFDVACVTALLGDLGAVPGSAPPFTAIHAARRARGWRRLDGPDDLGEEDHAALDALAGWSVGYSTLGRFRSAAAAARERVARLRDPHAPVELTTVHGAKGREWPTVVVIGFEEERFPNRRALVDAADPARAVEEERRLAYVALTRATQQLVLAFDPARPSRFIGEMGLDPGATARRRERRR